MTAIMDAAFGVPRERDDEFDAALDASIGSIFDASKS
jgi:hypothetical protein